MYPFEYAAAATLDDALGLLREHGDEAKVLAGGQSLIPILQYRLARPRVLIDINGLPLGDIVFEDGRVRLGALVRHHQLEESDAIARRCPVLGEAARLIGNVRVRTLGTVGGTAQSSSEGGGIGGGRRAGARSPRATSSRAC